MIKSWSPKLCIIEINNRLCSKGSLATGRWSLNQKWQRCFERLIFEAFLWGILKIYVWRLCMWQVSYYKFHLNCYVWNKLKKISSELYVWKYMIIFSNSYVWKYFMTNVSDMYAWKYVTKQRTRPNSSNMSSQG